jgi:hypothetical protein
LNVTPVMSATPGTIAGPTDACTAVAQGRDYTYTIRKVPLATGYSWSMIGSDAAKATITSHPGGSGVNDTIVTIHFNSDYASASVAVSSIRNCGISVQKTVKVATSKIGAPATLSGPAMVCPGSVQIYRCTKVVNATSYSWSVPLNATFTHVNAAGADDTAIIVTFPPLAGFVAAGKVAVQALSPCLGAAAKTLTIAKLTTGCRVSTARYATPVATTAATATKLDVSIYPNPSKGNFNIAINSSDRVSAAQVEIVNEYGQSVYQRNTTNNNGVIELKVNNNLANGIYMVTCKVGVEKITKRLVISK